MPGTSELVKPLADAGVASNVIRILEEQRIDGADAINDLDANDWARLYELGIKVGDKAAIQQVARKLRTNRICPCRHLVNAHLPPLLKRQR